MTIEDLKSGFHYGAHANGQYLGHRLTNSKEAFLYWYAKGTRFFEIDICASESGTYVALHKALTSEYLDRVQLPKIDYDGSAQWFIKQKLFRYTTQGLTPLSLQDIIDLMKDYPDIVVMFDPGVMQFDNYVTLLEQLRTMICDIHAENRALIETYDFKMQDALVEFAPELYGIFGLHDPGYETISQPDPKVLKSHRIEYVSYVWKYAKVEADQVKHLSEAGFVIVSSNRDNLHTKKMKELGISVDLVDYRYINWPGAGIEWFVRHTERRIKRYYYRAKTGRNTY